MSETPTNAPGAVASLVLGILGIVICGILAPFAWQQGRQAEAHIRANPSLGGGGMATAGKILGIIGTALLVLGIIHPDRRRRVGQPPRLTCD